MMEGGGFVYKAHVHYKCREGYEMQGSGTLTCGPNGKWIGETPVCKGAFHVTIHPWFRFKVQRAKYNASRCEGHAGFHSHLFCLKYIFVDELVPKVEK